MEARRHVPTDQAHPAGGVLFLKEGETGGIEPHLLRDDLGGAPVRRLIAGLGSLVGQIALDEYIGTFREEKIERTSSSLRTRRYSSRGAN